MSFRCSFSGTFHDCLETIRTFQAPEAPESVQEALEKHVTHAKSAAVTLLNAAKQYGLRMDGSFGGHTDSYEHFQIDCSLRVSAPPADTS
jgi:hypothetical protein